MTISYVGAGAFTAVAGSVALPYIAGAATDQVVALYGIKPFSNTLSIGSSGMSLTSVNADVTSGSVANANGSGSVKAAAFASSALTIPTTAGTLDAGGGASASPAFGQTLRFAITADRSWAAPFGIGLADTDETGTVVNASGTVSAGDFQAGDWVVIGAMIKDDVPTHTAPMVMIPGCTLDTITWLPRNATTTGNDGASYVGYAQITSGSALSGSASYTATSSVLGAAATAVVLVRLREVAVPKVTALSAAEAAAGTSITITGVNFTGATQVTFGPTPAASFTVVNDTTITAVVPESPVIYDAFAGDGPLATAQVPWMTPRGTWEREAGQARLTASYADSQNVAVVENNVSDMIIDVTLGNVVNAGAGMGFCFRFQDVNNYMIMPIRVGGGPFFIEFYRWSNNGVAGYTTLARGQYDTAWVSGDRLRLIARGLDMIVQRNETTVLTLTLPAATFEARTGAGVYAYVDPGDWELANSRYDDFMARPLSDVRVTTPNGTSNNTSADNFVTVVPYPLVAAEVAAAGFGIPL